jgi:hypothetical protein
MPPALACEAEVCTAVKTLNLPNVSFSVSSLLRLYLQQHKPIRIWNQGT